MTHSMEHMEDHYIKIINYKKKFFLKSFVISAIIFLLSALLCMLFHNTFAVMADTIYKIHPEDYSRILGMVFGIWEILIIQFTLIPFIALACLQKHLEKCKKNE